MISKIIKVSEKGQIAIPKEMREELRLDKGDSLLIVQSGNRLMMEKPKAPEDDFEKMNSDEVAAELWDNKYDEIWDEA